jgi:hypothetical protein
MGHDKEERTTCKPVKYEISKGKENGERKERTLLRLLHLSRLAVYR